MIERSAYGSCRRYELFFELLPTAAGDNGGGVQTCLPQPLYTSMYIYPRQETMLTRNKKEATDDDQA
jgi:hypothetical protein